MNRLNAWAPHVLSLVRIISALLFLEHGTMKLLHFPGAQPGAPNPLPTFLVVGALLEVVGGGLLAAGLFTRQVAFVLSGEMAVAYLLVHARGGPWPGLNGGDAAILYCWIFFYFVFAGGGPISLDAVLRGRRR